MGEGESVGERMWKSLGKRECWRDRECERVLEGESVGER